MWLLTVTHPADVVVTDSEDGSCGFGRHGDADRREVTPVLANLCRDRRHGDGRLRAREDSAGPDFRSADSVRSGAQVPTGERPDQRPQRVGQPDYLPVV